MPGLFVTGHSEQQVHQNNDEQSPDQFQRNIKVKVFALNG
jgi:hypothetical protein